MSVARRMCCIRVTVHGVRRAADGVIVDHLSTRLRLWISVALLLAAAPAVQAQDDPDFTSLNLEKLMTVEVDSVHGASRYLQKISEAPASITIVTADDIRA